jgi:hypothetical protein
VTLYRETDRAFAAGDRVQLTAPDRAQHLANRELGTIEQLQAKGELRLRLDSGHTVALDVREHPHLDYGYAVTSHSSHGQTADRVLVHIDMQRAGEQLVNRRLAYVAISRGRYDAQIYTNDKAQLAAALDRDVSHRAAIEPTHVRDSPARRSSGHQRASTASASGSDPRDHGRRLSIRARCWTASRDPHSLGGRAALDAVCAPCWSNALMP